jgi:hypothetical protein
MHMSEDGSFDLEGRGGLELGLGREGGLDLDLDLDIAEPDGDEDSDDGSDDGSAGVDDNSDDLDLPAPDGSEGGDGPDDGPPPPPMQQPQPEPPLQGQPDPRWAQLLFIFIWLMRTGGLSRQQRRLIRCWLSLIPADDPLGIDAEDPWGELEGLLEQYEEALLDPPAIYLIHDQADIDALDFLREIDRWRATWGLEHDGSIADVDPDGNPVLDAAGNPVITIAQAVTSYGCCIFVYPERVHDEAAAYAAASGGDVAEVEANLLDAVELHELMHYAFGEDGPPAEHSPAFYALQGLLEDILGIDDPARKLVLAAAGFSVGEDPADPNFCP